MVRRFGRRGGMRRARRLIRRTVASMGPIEAKRVVLDGFSIPARSAAAYDNPQAIGLVVCQESVNEETESNGTTVAEIPLYSKIVGMKGSFTIHGGSSGDRIRWLLYKRPDGEALTSVLTDAFFHSSDDSPTMRELRANTLAKGYSIMSDKLAGRVSFHVRRSTLKRLGNMREQDAIYLLVAISSSTASTVITGFGTIYCRLN